MSTGSRSTRRHDGPPDTQAPLVAVRDLQKRYGDFQALNGVSFEVHPGEVVGLLGPNGAGKTTCLSCLLGLVEPTAGDVAVAGVDAQAEPSAVHRHTAAMLEGARNVYWRLTPRENLAFFAGVAGRDTDELRDRHDELLERLGLADRADDPVRELSRGMKQKVALIAAPVGEFPLVRALPVVQANVMLGRAMREGVGLLAFSATDHAIALTVAVSYLVGGYVVFRLCLGRARRRGVLGDY